ncbi:MAG: T9SS type A sorting domain-containing protein [candidate division Zixibacteria bacterium]|nr:T9SS type A sorting domain-containing protein [candidate division Zixibacteria bacterium]
MRYLFILVSVIVCFLPVPVLSVVINIPDDFQSIQQGIIAADDGDTVLVQPGTYYENISIRNIDILLTSTYLLNQDTASILTTIIDGAGNGSVVNAYQMPDSGTIICGFTIQNGRNVRGGGIFMANADITVCHNIIKNNQAVSDGGQYAYGGGIYCLDCSPVISENIITYNTSEYFPYKDGFGGGICCNNANALIVNNQITYNTASGITSGGGGFYAINSNPEMGYNVLTENISNWGGAIFYDSNCNGSIYRNLIFANYGGGILCRNTAEPEITNNTITSNYWAGGITCLSQSIPVVLNNIVWENEVYEMYVGGPTPPEITFNDIRDGWEGEGNIDIDPLFVDSDNNNFHLLPGSPCIDAGSPDSPYDPDNTRIDIGVHYYDQTTAIDSDPVMPGVFKLNQNYPNPFNASTTINYQLPKSADVEIEIFDILGRHVATLINQRQQAGDYQAIWNAVDFSSGMYFYKVRAGDYIEIRKMLLLK